MKGVRGDGNPVINIKEKRPPNEDASLAVRVAGAIDPGDVRIFMPIEIFEELAKRVTRNPEAELTGILLGDLYRGGTFDYLEVEGFLPLRESDARFTQETWEALYAELDRRNTDTNIIGWFFTDPSGNLALDGYRQFVQESFFDDPFQIAMGIDPSSGRYRFFQWKRGEVAPVSGHHVFGAVPRTEEVRRLAGRPLADVRSIALGGVRVQSRRPAGSSPFVGALVLVAILLTVGNLYWSTLLEERISEVDRKAVAVATAQDAMTRAFEQVELAARTAADRLMNQPAGVSESRAADFESRLTDLKRNYAKLKIHLDRSNEELKTVKANLGDTEKKLGAAERKLADRAAAPPPPPPAQAPQSPPPAVVAAPAPPPPAQTATPPPLRGAEPAVVSGPGQPAPPDAAPVEPPPEDDLPYDGAYSPIDEPFLSQPERQPSPFATPGGEPGIVYETPLGQPQR